MQILSHRGWWQHSRKNHLIAFKKEFEYCLKDISQPYKKKGGGSDKILHLMNCYLREMVGSCAVFGI